VPISQQTKLDNQKKRLGAVKPQQKAPKSNGAKAIYTSPYSPEFNPIEHLWWTLKSFFRKFAPKSSEIVEHLLRIGVMLCSSTELRNYFAHCCYCAE